MCISAIKINYKSVIYFILLQNIISDAAEILEVTLYPRKSNNVMEEASVTLRCVGVGHPPPLVQWRKLNGSLSDTVSINVINMSLLNNEGKVIVDLTITEVSRMDTGDYECLANNILNDATRNISLIVQCMQCFMCMYMRRLFLYFPYS